MRSPGYAVWPWPDLHEAGGFPYYLVVRRVLIGRRTHDKLTHRITTTFMLRWIRILTLAVLCGWLGLPAQAALSAAHGSMPAGHEMPAPALVQAPVKADCMMLHRPGDCPMQAHGASRGERSSHCAACLSVVADLPQLTQQRFPPRAPDRVWSGPSVTYSDFIPGIPSPPPCVRQA